MRVFLVSRAWRLAHAGSPRKTVVPFAVRWREGPRSSTRMSWITYVSTRRGEQRRGFLDDLSLRPVSLPPGVPFTAIGLALGQGASPLEVLVTSSTTAPNATTLRSAWKARNAGRAAPLLFVVIHDERASLCGPAGEDPPAYIALDRGQVERICREAIEQPDRHAALRALRDVLPSLESDLAGLRNEGFLATHELRAGARQRADWQDAGRKARGALAKRGTDLLRALGFGIEPCDRVTSILRAGERKIAVAVLLTRDESPELSGERFSGLSPITYALTVADRENLDWVVVQHGAKVRIYPTHVGAGVGRRGRTETFIECHAGLLPDGDAAYLWLLCSAEALTPGGSLEQILEASGRFAGGLAERLRERIYQSVVPRLAQGIVAARGLRRPTAQDLADTYEMALTVLFRLLFIAYAEDKDLLPYRWNGLYQRRSLKTKAQELAELARSAGPFDAGDTLWDGGFAPLPRRGPRQPRVGRAGLRRRVCSRTTEKSRQPGRTSRASRSRTPSSARRSPISFSSKTPKGSAQWTSAAWAYASSGRSTRGSSKASSRSPRPTSRWTGAARIGPARRARNPSSGAARSTSTTPRGRESPRARTSRSPSPWTTYSTERSNPRSSIISRASTASARRRRASASSTSALPMSRWAPVTFSLPRSTGSSAR